MIQVYTGDGKGKTTASLGLAMRALGHGWRVKIVQFLKKGDDFGECRSARKLEGLSIEQYGSGEFIFGDPSGKDRELADQAMGRAEEIALSGDCELLVLDEFLGALSLGLIERERAEKLLDSWPERLELVLTGRGVPDWIVERADLVSEIKEIKHPFRAGVPSRQGIEY